MIEAEKFESPTPMQMIQRTKSNTQERKTDCSQISSFANPTKINEKNVIKIDGNDKITIKPQLLRTMSTRSKWGEGSSSAKEELKEDDTMSMTSEISRMDFEFARSSIGRSMSLERKVNEYKTRIVNEPI